jgi:hypothetical protein
MIMSAANFETKNSYEQRTDNLTVNNGSRFVSVSITPGREYGTTVSTGLTPTQARALAADLIARADSVDRFNGTV